MRKSVFVGVVPFLFVAACAANLPGDEDPPVGPNDASIDGADARSTTPTDASGDSRFDRDGQGPELDASTPLDASTAPDGAVLDGSVRDASSPDAGDVTPPDISFGRLALGAVNRFVAPGLATLFDSGKIASYEVFVDGVSQGGVTLATPTVSVSLPTPSPLVDGTTVTFRIDARDAAGNRATSTRTVTNAFDLTAPVVTVAIDPTSFPIPYYATALVSVSDDLIPAATVVRLTVDGAPVSLTEKLPNITPGTRWYEAKLIEVSYARNGIRPVLVQATDSNGQVGSASTDIVSSFAPGWAGGNIGTSGSDFLNGIAVAPSDDVYIAGGTDSALHGAPIGTSDAVIEKRTSAGALEWATRFGAAGAVVSAKAVAADSRGAVVVGETRGAFLGPADPAYSPFVTAYTSAGVQRFATRVDAKPCGTCFAGSVQVDDTDGAIWMTALRFSGGQNLPSRLFRLDTNGTITATQDLPVGIAKGGMRYGGGRLAFVANQLAAGFTQTATGNDLGVIMLDRNGAEVWRRQYPSPVPGLRGIVGGLDFDASGNLYVATGARDQSTTWIRKIDPSGTTVATFMILATPPGWLAVHGSHFVHSAKVLGRYATLDGAPAWTYPFVSSTTEALAVDSQGSFYLGSSPSLIQLNIAPYLGGSADMSVWKVSAAGTLE